MLKKVLKFIEKETGICISEFDGYKNFREQMKLDFPEFVRLLEKIERQFHIVFPVSAARIDTLNEFVDFLRIILQKKGEKLI